MPDALQRTWSTALWSSLQPINFMMTRGDRTQLEDYAVLYARPIPIFFAGADHSSAATRRKLLEETGIEDNMKESAEVLLHWLELKLCADSAELYPEIAGSGSSRVPVCAKQGKHTN